MEFFSISFLVFLSALVVAFYASRSQAVRRVVLSLASLLFLSTFILDLGSWLALGGFIVVSYGMLCLVRATGWSWLPAVCIVAALLALVYLKRYDFLGVVLPERLFDHPWELIGISYMSFKLIHMLVDLHQGQLAPFSLASYANYQLGFFCLVAGPIQRYNDFDDFWRQIDRGCGLDAEGLAAWSRALTGMVKVGLLGAYTLHTYDHAKARFLATDSPGVALAEFALVFYAYPLFVYLNFSGYCDIVIASARLLGMRHQENFDRPYLARNLIEFWNRWHISLTMWIRDYLFMTSYKFVAERWPSLAQGIGYFLLFLALFLAGVWHGSSWNFLIFGALHGLGVAAVQVYGDVLKAAFGRSGVKRYLKNRFFRAASGLVTLNYICFCFLFFRPELDETWRVLEALREKLLALL